MKDWQFNVLFILACVGALVLLLGEKIGVTARPEVVTVFGAIMAYILTQKRRDDDDDDTPDPTPGLPEGAPRG